MHIETYGNNYELLYIYTYICIYRKFVVIFTSEFDIGALFEQYGIQSYYYIISLFRMAPCIYYHFKKKWTKQYVKLVIITSLGWSVKLCIGMSGLHGRGINSNVNCLKLWFLLYMVSVAGCRVLSLTRLCSIFYWM